MRVLLVTGVGASGTSAISGCLHKMGVCMGYHLTQHPAGFGLFEDQCAYGLFGLPETKVKGAFRRYALTHFRSDPCGMKHTLLWKSLPWSLEMLRDMGHDPRVVVGHRTFMRSVDARENGRCPPGRFYSRGEATRWAVEATMGLMTAVYQIQGTWPVLHIGYEDLIAEPEREIARLAEFADVEVTGEAVAHVRRD